MKDIYKQIVHWNKICFTLPGNTTGFKLTDTLERNLPVNLNIFNAESVMYGALVTPHLIFARTITESDALNNQTIATWLDKRMKGEVDILFFEAKITQERKISP